MYCITLRNKFDKTIIGWYDASASNFSTDQRRAKHFFDRVDADLVADQLRRMYPRLAQDIEVTAVQPTGLTGRSRKPGSGLGKSSPDISPTTPCRPIARRSLHSATTSPSSGTGGYAVVARRGGW